jgi:hypothetical protein
MAEAAKPRTKAKGRPAPEARANAPGEADGHVCTVSFCPICLAVTAGHAVRPDAVEHLLAASREFILALSAILGARATEGGEPEPEATLTRIEIE